MYTSLFRACLFLIGFMLALTVNAAGLGKLTINSFLGQPLNAEIDLVSVSDDELSSLKADFASREAFAQAGIPYEPIFSTFKVSIEPRTNGESYVKIVSPQSINEPFLNLLVELSWASGRLLREYTVLLDPAETKRSEPVLPVVPSISEEVDVAENTSVVSDELQTTAAHDEQMVETTQSAPVPVAKQVSDAQAADTYGPILEGDTLSSIARQVKPDEVSINQMLVALYRANREAFIANNMNLLRTGVVLKIPDLQDLNQITEKEALTEIRIQAGDWHEYRNNLAGSTQEAQELEAFKQTDSGQITTTINSGDNIRSETPQEVLRLSSGESSSDAQNADLNTLNRLRMMEEDAIARNLALEEANERVAMLEKNIENLQKLLALQNPELAQAQINAQTPQTDTETIEVISSESIQAAESELDIVSEDDSAIELDVLSEPDTMISMSETGTENIIETAPLTDVEQATSTPMREDVPAAVEPVTDPIQSIETEGTSFLDQVMDNMVYIGAGSAVFLLVAIAIMIRRGKKAEEETAIEEAKHEELSSALRNKTAAVVAAAHATDSNDKDDFDDFDKTAQFFVDEDSPEKEHPSKTDLFSDTDDQTKALEQESFDSNQAIELDFSNENEKVENESVNQLNEADSFNDAFDETKPEFEGFNEVSSESSNDAIDFDSSFDPVEDGESSNSLDDISAVDDKTKFSAAEKETSVDDEHLIDFPDNGSIESSGNDDYELKMDIDDMSDSQESDELKEGLADVEPNVKSASEFESDTQSEANNTLDFSVDPSTIDLSDEDAKVNETDFSEDSLDNEINMLDIPDASSESGSVSSERQIDVNEDISTDSLQQTSEIDFSDINLDIENPVETSGTEDQDKIDDSASEIEDSNLHDEQWHEVKTKIDLAKAYLEMEDNEGAREMLEEVLREGDAEQQKTAQELLEKV